MADSACAGHRVDQHRQAAAVDEIDIAKVDLHGATLADRAREALTLTVLKRAETTSV